MISLKIYVQKINGNIFMTQNILITALSHNGILNENFRHKKTEFDLKL